MMRAFVLFLAGLVISTSAFSQCMPVPGMQPATGIYTAPNPDRKYIAWTLTGVAMCSPAAPARMSFAMVNGAICYSAYTVTPGPFNNCTAGNCSGLLARFDISGGGDAITTGPKNCTWTCTGCSAPTVTRTFMLSNANGLPVELMDFSVSDNALPVELLPVGSAASGR